MKLIALLSVMLCFNLFISLATSSALANGSNYTNSDIPTLEEPPSVTSEPLAQSASPGIKFWIFVALFSLLPIGIFVYLFQQLRGLFKPKSKNKFRHKKEQEYQEKNDNQTSFQVEVDDIND